MPRFNEKKYDPRDDSSPGVRTEGKLVLVVKEGECACGCGHEPFGKKSTFLMGHDARLRGKLIRAHLTDTRVVLSDGVSSPSPVVSAMDAAERHGWEKYLRDATARREEKNRALLRKALGSDRLVKVGRWEYTGQVVAVFDRDGEFEIEYVTKDGSTKRKRVPADQAKEV